jgi:hypothetical protein
VGRAMQVENREKVVVQFRPGDHLFSTLRETNAEVNRNEHQTPSSRALSQFFGC